MRPPSIAARILNLSNLGIGVLFIESWGHFSKPVNRMLLITAGGLTITDLVIYLVEERRKRL